MEYNHIDYVPILKALADETRLKIIHLLSCEELCACHILKNFDITQPTLSYHMKILVDCGLVITNKKGSWMHYRLNCEKISELRGYLNYL